MISAQQKDQEAWERGIAWRAAYHDATFTEAGLALGAGTILTGPGPFETASDRLVALLTVLKRGLLAPDVMDTLAKAAADWARGAKALAQIRLAFVALPRVETRHDAYRLHLADQAMALGVAPDELLKHLGLPIEGSGLKKIPHYNPDQPRKPKGQPDGGQYAPEGGGGASEVPVFFPGEEPITMGHERSIEDGDARGPARKPKDADPLKPNPLRVPPMPAGSPKPAGTPVPRVLPAPGSGAPPSEAPSQKPAESGPETTPSSGQKPQDRDEKSCPAAVPDTPNGPNAREDSFEVDAGIRVNPTNPTPFGYAYPMWSQKYGKYFKIDDCFKTQGDLIDGDMEKRRFG